MSHLATRLLAQRSSSRAHLEYWRKIGFGVKHDTAFEQAFGLKRQTFQKEFETLRKDLIAAQKYGEQ